MTFEQAIVLYLPYFLSCVTIYMTWMAGNKNRHAWAIGTANQAVWFTWIWFGGHWGLLPMNISMAALYLWNHFKWNKPEPVRTYDKLGDQAHEFFLDQLRAECSGGQIKIENVTFDHDTKRVNCQVTFSQGHVSREYLDRIVNEFKESQVPA